MPPGAPVNKVSPHDGETSHPPSARSNRSDRSASGKPTVKSLLKEAGMLVKYYEEFLEHDVATLEKLAGLGPSDLDEIGVSPEDYGAVFMAIGKANQYLKE